MRDSIKRNALLINPLYILPMLKITASFNYWIFESML